MRSAVIAAALAAGVIAVPYNNYAKRDLVIVTDVKLVYSTVIVTETQGAKPTPKPQNKHHVHQDYHSTPSYANQPAPSPTSVRTDLSNPTPTPGNGNGGGSNNDGGSSSGGGSSNGGGNDSGLSGSAGSSYSDIAVWHHNCHRRNHSAPDIVWDDSLAKSAADIAATCIYEHNVEMDGGGYGQNIAAGVPPDNISAIITNLFYNGEVNYYQGLYGEANPSMSNFEEWGHFTQIVWKATTHFGCATHDCTGQGLANVGSDVSPYFTVCNYKKPGNFGGEYGQNVGEPLGEPSANWDSGLS